MQAYNTDYEMITAPTGTLNTAMAVFSICQRDHTCRIWIDHASTGKTVTVRHYCSRFKEAAYLDCSQSKTMNEFVRAMAAAWGLDSQGKIKEVYEATVQHIRNLKNPIIFLDETGDLGYNAFLHIKAYWNAVNIPDLHCSFIMVGAQGLRKKIERMRSRDKVGYEELQHRFGDTFMQLWPTDKTEFMTMFYGHAKVIAEKNCPEIPLEILLDSNKQDKMQGIKQIQTLRRLTDNIIFQKNKTAKK